MTWGAAARMTNTTKEKTMKNKNPYNFCTLDDSSDCASCGLMGKLSCKWDRNTLNGFFCSRCINFSCVGNTVPKKEVDEYLRRNPVMEKAWESSGYKIN